MGGKKPGERNEVIAGEPGELVIWHGNKKIKEKSLDLVGTVTCFTVNVSQKAIICRTYF